MNTTYEIRAYHGTEASLTIPDTLNGKKVTSVNFYGGMLLESHLSTYVKNITIPDSVTRLGNSAFMDCAFLETVTLPDTIKEIGSCAFASCVRLKSLTIPQGVKTIQDSTFSVCRSLESI